jgi:hypothetical protein
MDELTARLNQLERQLRSLRRTIGVLAVALVATLVSCATLGHAQGSPSWKNAGVMTLRKLSIIDQSGKERIVLGSLPDGSAGIAQYSMKGGLRMNVMTKADNSAGVLLYDADGNQRVGSLTLPNGDAGMVLRDPEGVTRLTVTTKTNGAAGLDHYDRNTKLRISAGTSYKNQSNVFHFDPDGIKRVMSLTSQQGAVAIGITDRKGKPTWFEGSE